VLSRNGTLSRHIFRRYTTSLREDVRAVLEQVRTCGCGKTAATCRELLAVEPAMWTFVRVEGVEPTNYHIERMLRLVVLWRKKSFGSQSEWGCRFVERLLTVVQRRRLQGRLVRDYSYEAAVAHRADLPAPPTPADQLNGCCRSSWGGASRGSACRRSAAVPGRRHGRLAIVRSA
jgi:transposase